MENKTPLCFPLSSLPREFQLVVAEGVRALDWEVLPFSLAHASSCPSFLPSARL